MAEYNITNWYWNVGDGPSGQVYSSAGAQYVATTDTTFAAWLAAGNATTSIATYADLMGVLSNYPAGTPYGAFIAGGLTVTSTATPALNGVYPIDAQTQVDISTEAAFISTFGEFTSGGTSNLPWTLANGALVTFPTTAEFLSFAKAAGQTVAAAKLAAAQGSPMPSSSIAIP
jgi:hypothetical protein